MPVSEYTKRVINKAADKIEEVGWWNGTTPNPEKGTTCVALAITHQAAGGYNEMIELAEALGWTGVESGYYKYITRWNDKQPDGETVINKLREIAK